MQKNFREKVENAWKDMEPPFRISGSDEGDEPMRLEKEFEARPGWEDLNHRFLDSTPDGLGSALSFFADEAFRYYIAAYMVADLEKQFDMVDVVFSLTHGLDDQSKKEKINPLRFGEQDWFSLKQAGFSMFTREQISCIIDFLSIKREDEFGRQKIDEALDNYWRTRHDELSEA